VERDDSRIIMADLPESVRIRLADECFRRRNPAEVENAFLRLLINPPELVLAFYLNFQGPFGSRRTGFELLDLFEQKENVQTVTLVCREEFNFPVEALALTDLNANAILVYNTRLDQVFNVDFEGGDIEFLAGKLKPQWNSFAEFLQYYFS